MALLLVPAFSLALSARTARAAGADLAGRTDPVGPCCRHLPAALRSPSPAPPSSSPSARRCSSTSWRPACRPRPRRRLHPADRADGPHLRYRRLPQRRPARAPQLRRARRDLRRVQRLHHRARCWRCTPHGAYAPPPPASPLGGLLMVAVQVPSVWRQLGPARRGAGRSVGRTPAPGVSARPTPHLGLRLLVPVACFALCRQSQVLVERFLASSLPAGAISHLNYAQKIAQMPMVLSLMICTVTFPVVARALADGEAALARRRVERDLTWPGWWCCWAPRTSSPARRRSSKSSSSAARSAPPTPPPPPR